MSTRNIVSKEIPQEVLQKITDALNTAIKEAAPYLIALTVEERRTILKMGDGTEPFVEKVLGYIESNPQFLPAVCDPVEMKKDWVLWNQLVPLLRMIEQLQSNLSDTIMEAGSELFADCLGYYGGVQFGVKMNTPDAKPIEEDLRKRFAGQGKRKKPPVGN